MQCSTQAGTNRRGLTSSTSGINSTVRRVPASLLPLHRVGCSSTFLFHDAGWSDSSPGLHAVKALEEKGHRVILGTLSNGSARLLVDLVRFPLPSSHFHARMTADPPACTTTASLSATTLGPPSPPRSLHHRLATPPSLST